MKAFIKKFLFIVLALLVAFMLFMYFGTYSSGNRAGKIVKISESGVIFKTWEGQLDLGTFGAVKSSNFASETFEFSIDGSNQELLDILHKAQLSGHRVSLKYTEKYMKFPWRGNTKYMVVAAEVYNEGDSNSLPLKKID